MTLEGALTSQEDRLLGCVHCGFCLPACPTYVRIGDEADSPRGRLYLMRAVVEGRLDAGSDAFQTHIDRCLGCRACETVCPSGVDYGFLLERARAEARRARPPAALTRVILRVFRSRSWFAAAMVLSRVLRASGLPRWAARLLPEGNRAGMAAGMLAASRGPDLAALIPGATGASPVEAFPKDSEAPAGSKGPVAFLEGCVQAGLFGHVNRATVRVVSVNGYEAVDSPGQGCCGALHSHAGALDEARELARANIRTFERCGADWIVVNAAGCGAAMKDYRELLADDPEFATRAVELSRRIKDVSELLVSAPIQSGAPLPTTVSYDAPCHLLHAQGVNRAPLDMLAAIPGLTVHPLQGASECCGGAGIYGLTHPELGGRIGRDKIDDVVAAGANLLTTGNPGCMMQIGSGLLSRGCKAEAVHPVELLDESYRRAGLYDGT